MYENNFVVSVVVVGAFFLKCFVGFHKLCPYRVSLMAFEQHETKLNNWLDC